MFTFAWPYAFTLLPVILILQKYLPLHTKQQTAMLRVPVLTRWQAFQEVGAAPLRKSSQTLLIYLAWGLLISACANPQWLGAPLPVQVNGRNIMLAVDLSPSMAIPDAQRDDQTINRLQSIKTAATDFIQQRRGDKLGLIVFGSKAYLQTPLTFDRVTVQAMLADATIGLAGDHTAIGDALGLAVKKFTNEAAASRVLILLTDGGNNAGVIDPYAAAKVAQQQHIKIYTIGIGATQLAINDGFFGSHIVNPSADLDEHLLKSIADTTGGKYFRAEDQTALANILSAINQLEPVDLENKTVRPITALLYWPLSLVMLILIWLILPAKQVSP